MLRNQMMSILLNFLILKLPTLPLPDSQTTYYAALDLLQQQKQNNNKLLKIGNITNYFYFPTRK